jgi:hypothetical protein
MSNAISGGLGSRTLAALGIGIVATVATPSLANAPPGQYAVATATVTDTKTELVWQRAEDGGLYTWLEAKSHCASLNPISFGGFTGWRLPTMKEVQTIVEDGPNPTIDTSFTGTKSEFYWTTTPSVQAPSKAFVMAFDYGYTDTLPQVEPHRVRCVR